MKISSISKNQTNFNGIYMFNVPKSAFKHPENLDKVLKDFNKMLPDLFPVEPKTTLQRIFNKFRILKPINNPIFFLEQPFYVPMTKKLKSIGDIYSLGWLGLRSGAAIDLPIHKDSHSFIAMTEEHILQFENLFEYTMSELSKTNEQVEIKATDPKFADLRHLAVVNEKLMNWIKPFFPDVYKS